MTIKIAGRYWKMPLSVYDLERLIRDVVGLEAYPSELGDHLQQESFITGALMPPDAEGVRDCIREARRFLAERASLEPKVDQRHDAPTSTPGRRLISARDEARAEFFSEHVAKVA